MWRLLLFALSFLETVLKDEMYSKRLTDKFSRIFKCNFHSISKNFFHFIWCKQSSIFKPFYRLKTYIISCRLKFLGLPSCVWAILMNPQVFLLDVKGVNVTSLFDLHPNRQEKGSKWKVVPFVHISSLGFHFQINYSNPIWAWVPLQTEGILGFGIWVLVVDWNFVFVWVFFFL